MKTNDTVLIEATYVTDDNLVKDHVWVRINGTLARVPTSSFVQSGV